MSPRNILTQVHGGRVRAEKVVQPRVNFLQNSRQGVGHDVIVNQTIWLVDLDDILAYKIGKRVGRPRGVKEKRIRAISCGRADFKPWFNRTNRVYCTDPTPHRHCRRCDIITSAPLCTDCFKEIAEIKGDPWYDLRTPYVMKADPLHHKEKNMRTESMKVRAAKVIRHFKNMDEASIRAVLDSYASTLDMRDTESHDLIREVHRQLERQEAAS